MKMKTYMWGIGLIALVIAALIMFSGTGKSFENLETFDGDVKIYKSSSCGCCGVYGGYFQREGNDKAEIVSMESIDDIKKQYGVPANLESCHTTVIGDYFVEGHIPLEAVEKLLSEKPDIKGIAMPGMPEGSPGMPGTKRADFVIYAVNHDGTYEEWMRI